jgi:hypothetical protein
MRLSYRQIVLVVGHAVLREAQKRKKLYFTNVKELV